MNAKENMSSRFNIAAGIFQAAAYFMIPLSYGQWPYFFYQALRFIVAGAFLTMLPRLPFRWAILAAGIALLFNPIIPFHFDRNIWSLLDLVAFILLCLIGSKQRTFPSNAS
jgi:hypothetical protein